MLNETSLRSCVVDEDCRVAEICVSAKASWNEHGVSYCSCNLWYGWQGETCMEFSATTFFCIAYSVVQILVAAVCCAWLYADLYRLLRAFDWRPPFNASTITFSMTTTGLTAYIVWRLLYLLGASIPSANDRLLQGDHTHAEAHSFQAYSRPVIVIVQILAFTSALTVSVIWVEVSMASQAMRTKLVENVERYRKAVFVIDTLFVLAMTAVAALGRFDLSAVLAMPFLILLIILFTLGRMRMCRLLNDALSVQSESTTESADNSGDVEEAVSTSAVRDRRGKKSKDTRTKMKRAMLAIKRTAGHITAALLIIIISGIAYYAINELPAAGWQEFAPEGKFSMASLIASLIPFGVLYLYVATFLYVHRNINKIIAKQTTKPDPSSLGPSQPSTIGDFHTKTFRTHSVAPEV